MRRQEAGVTAALLATVVLASAAVADRAADEGASAGQRRRRGADGAPTPASGRKVLYWYDPMAPGIEVRQAGQVALHGHAARPEVRGRGSRERGGPSASAVTLSPEAIRAAGIATVAGRARNRCPARSAPSARSRSTRRGRCACRPAWPGASRSSTRTSPGRRSRAGAPLYAIYSPELVATEREYLLSLENRRAALGRDAGGDPRGRRARVAAARDRLRLWGIGAGADRRARAEPQARARADVPLADHRDRDAEERASRAST